MTKDRSTLVWSDQYPKPDDYDYKKKYDEFMSQNKNNHWWPQCVSRKWIDPTDNLIARIDFNKELKRISNKGAGGVNKAFTIKHKKDEMSAWDCNYETLFQDIDGKFPEIIRLLESMREKPKQIESLRSLIMELFQSMRKKREQPERQIEPIDIDKNMVDDIITAMVSILVRSPRYMELSKRQLINLSVNYNMPHVGTEDNVDKVGRGNALGSFKRIADKMKYDGKLVVLYAPEYTEFIFGDGFYYRNIEKDLGYEKRILMPLTPEIALLCVTGARYRYIREIGDNRKEPDIFSYYIDEREIARLNCVLQIYAGKELFFRSSEYFSPDYIADNCFGPDKVYYEQVYENGDWVDEFVYNIPNIVKPI